MKKIFSEVIPSVLLPDFQIDNSWIVTEEKKDHKIYNYFCSSCGLTEKIKVNCCQTKYYEASKYICPNCSNKNFFWSDENLQDLKMKAKFNINIEKFGQVSYIDIYINIPLIFNTSISTIKQSEIYKINTELLNNYLYKKPIEKIEIYGYCSPVQNIYKLINKYYRDDILNFFNNCEKYKVPTEKKMILFETYIRNKHIKEFEVLLIDDEKALNYSRVTEYLNSLLSHGNSSKSIKKALYQSFINKLEEFGSYNPEKDNIILNFFKDLNYIRQLLNMKRISFFNNTSSVIKQSLKTLNKFYSQKQIFNLLYKYQDQYSSVICIILDEICSIDTTLFFSEYKKTRCNSKSVHDSLLKVLNKCYVSNIEYQSESLKYETTIEDLSFICPKNGKEICNWDDKLDKYLRGYIKDCYQKKSMIVGVFQNSKILYTIGFNEKNKLIWSMSGKYNISNKKHLSTINKWIKRNNLELDYFLELDYCT